MHSKNYHIADIGQLSELGKMSYTLPDSGLTMKGKFFLNESVGLSGSEISFNAMAPGESMPFYHHHMENEEVYLVLSGTGEFQVDGDILPVKEGSVIRMAPAAVRTWRNTSEDTDLVFITIQAKANSMDNSKPTSDGVALEKKVVWSEPDHS